MSTQKTIKKRNHKVLGFFLFGPKFMSRTVPPALHLFFFQGSPPKWPRGRESPRVGTWPILGSAAETNIDVMRMEKKMYQLQM